jgi:hypothetical protein
MVVVVVDLVVYSMVLGYNGTAYARLGYCTYWQKKLLSVCLSSNITRRD